MDTQHNVGLMKAAGDGAFRGWRMRIFTLKRATLDYNWKLVSAEMWVYDVIISPCEEGSSRDGAKEKTEMERWR